MKRATRLFLLAGCAAIVILEAPAALAALAAGWRGPYAGRGMEGRAADFVSAGVRTLAAAPKPLALARR